MDESNDKFKRREKNLADHSCQSISLDTSRFHLKSENLISNINNKYNLVKDCRIKN